MGGFMKLGQVARRRSGSPSDLPSTAINEQFDTRDETGVIRSQKQCCLGNFIGFPHASHRDGGHYSCNGVCRLPVDNWRIGRTRANNIGTNVAVLEIRSPGSDERAESGLRCAIDTEGGRTFYACDGAIENNRTTIIHERKGLLHRE
jgi:hypothetical protein